MATGSVFSFKKGNNKKLAMVRSPQMGIRVNGQTFQFEDLNPTIQKFNEFWELMDTVQRHGYLRAAMSVIGRSAVGTWWTLRKHPEFGKGGTERQRKRLMSFYLRPNRQWDNIKDYISIAGKIMIATMYLRYFGQAAFYIVRDKEGRAVGLDFLYGLVVPNVDSSGYFKSPAFVQYPTSKVSDRVEFRNARDIVFLTNPDWTGSPLGGTDIEALSTYNLPLDLYLQTAARDYMKNRDRPEVVYSLPADISDEGFQAFVAEMEARRGAGTMGRNPIAVQGEFEVHELRPLPDALPYQDSRRETREEEMAVTGVSGAKLGLSDQMASANLREMRREFHETSLTPLFTLVEIGLYEQVHVREFAIDGWEFKFNSPDFLNAVEQATVHMRYHDMGVLNPNEIRAELNRAARKDEYGSLYIDQKLEEDEPSAQPQGSPPEGRPTEPDAPSQTGEPTMDGQDPPRGDQHDEEVRSMMDELRQWRSFALNRVKRGKPMRDFHVLTIPEEVKREIELLLSSAETADDVARIFGASFDVLENMQ